MSSMHKDFVAGENSCISYSTFTAMHTMQCKTSVLYREQLAISPRILCRALIDFFCTTECNSLIYRTFYEISFS